jgi:hypothetical protein
MKILLTESQFNLLMEMTSGLNDFMSTVINKYPEVEEFRDELEKFIVDSDCGKLTIEPMKMGLGVSLSDRCIISTQVLRYSLPNFLFVLFHEIAHQYQYKKYGIEKMYNAYLGKLSIKECAKWMKDVEIVADEFATRKIREYIKLGYIKGNNDFIKAFYKDVPESHFIILINTVKSMIKKNRIKSPEEISELIYNWIKAKI